jgi:hypothetical protein
MTLLTSVLMHINASMIYVVLLGHIYLFDRLLSTYTFFHWIQGFLKQFLLFGFSSAWQVYLFLHIFTSGTFRMSNRSNTFATSLFWEIKDHEKKNSTWQECHEGKRGGHHSSRLLGYMVGPISPLWVQLLQTLVWWNHIDLKPTIKETSPWNLATGRWRNIKCTIWVYRLWG